MAWSVDRLGRSLQDLVAFLSELHALHIDLFLHQQGLDTTTPGGKAMFQMMGVSVKVYVGLPSVLALIRARCSGLAALSWARSREADSAQMKEQCCPDIWQRCSGAIRVYTIMIALTTLLIARSSLAFAVHQWCLTF